MCSELHERNTPSSLSPSLSLPLSLSFPPLLSLRQSNDSHFTQLLSYNAFGDTLPAMNHSTADPGAVDNPVTIGESDGSFPELRLYSQKLSEMGAIGTIPVVPALPVEANVLEGESSIMNAT